MLQWLVRRRRPDAKKPDPSDQRLAVRHRLDSKRREALGVSVGVSAWPALIRDISTTGVGLVVGQRHAPGVILSVRIVHERSDFNRLVRLRVVHVELRPDRHWNTGCVFDEPLHPEVLGALV